MSIFEDPTVFIHVGGVEVDLPTAQDLAADNSAGRVNWRVVRRWCLDHPLQARLFVDRSIQTCTHLRRSYPDLRVHVLNIRYRPDMKAKRADLVVLHVPPGTEDPFLQGGIFWEEDGDGPAPAAGSDEGPV